MIAMRGAVLVLVLVAACKADPDEFPYCCEEPPRFDAPYVPPTPEYPDGQQGCDVGQRATWIVIQLAPPERLGKLGCVPSSFGTVPLGGTCTVGAPGETTGFDDCVAGSICSEAVCRDICRLDAAAGSLGACASGTCTIDPLLFANGADTPALGACR